MRLIDADKLIEYFDGDLEGYDNREYILHMLDSKGRSARVEAIPIEWIKQWANEQFYTLDREMYLKDMLEDWEKENESK